MNLKSKIPICSIGFWFFKALCIRIFTIEILKKINFFILKIKLILSDLKKSKQSSSNFFNKFFNSIIPYKYTSILESNIYK